MSDLDVRYPVVIDNDFSIWRAFDNHYWPALYVLDRDGRVGFQHFGEEAYAESERAIQTLLGLDEPLSDVDSSGVAAPADWAALNSPETYLGSLRVSVVAAPACCRATSGRCAATGPSPRSSPRSTPPAVRSRTASKAAT